MERLRAGYAPDTNIWDIPVEERESLQMNVGTGFGETGKEKSVKSGEKGVTQGTSATTAES